ncbi:MAG TPA: DUF4384 domain-containing protein [Accumulibacter sp.]|uniref:glycoside hydrolase family protein n=1 Tax=Accumulibacter sp. TaxID=2053492 RepID=UPI002C74F79D|nr:DUF4384 domain-containing protein [Accumulibacter sp.]HNG15011.1 DUF4384 domain-containing protein [Accumulibacter sp.]HNN83040.1 DUF4384 domain-containing protein [Accumulibacter sp.]
MTNEHCGRALACCLIGSLLLTAGAQAFAQEPVRPASIGAPDAAAAADGTFRDALETAALLASGLKVRLNKVRHRVGERLAISVDVPFEGYLNVLSVGPDDVPTILFPNQLHTDNRVGIGAFALPTGQMKQELKATGPQGRMLVAAFLSREALDLQQGGADGRDADGKPLDTFGRLNDAGRRQLEERAAQSFASLVRTAPLLAGVAYGSVCAERGPCDTATLVENQAAGKTGEERVAPGLLLEPEIELGLPQGVRLRRVSDKGIALGKISEGFVGRLYDASGGHCSIAYGHVVKKTRCDGSEPVALQRGVSEEQGEMLLVEDMRRAQRAVMSLVTSELNDAQFAALCNFTYSVGAEKLRSSTLLKAINAGEQQRVPFQWRRWTQVGGKEHARLKLRREREIALYFEGGEVPAGPPAGEELAPIDIRIGELGEAGEAAPAASQ